MFIVMLKFSTNRANAGEFMDGHNQWLSSGFNDDVFLLAGSIKPGLGGAIIAHNVLIDDLQTRISEDPFVRENVVTAEIIEIDPAKADERLGFLLA